MDNVENVDSAKNFYRSSHEIPRFDLAKHANIINVL